MPTVKVTIRTIERWAKIIRDAGLILGIPTLIVVGVSLYNLEAEALKARIDAVEAQNKFLKETQFDRVGELIDGQKKVYETEHAVLVKQLEDAKKEGSQNAEEVARKLAIVSSAIQNLDTGRTLLKQHWRTYDMKNFTYVGSGQETKQIVYVDPLANMGEVIFDGVDLRHGSFKKTDLRGVDLSQAIIDADTKLPVVPK